MNMNVSFNNSANLNALNKLVDDANIPEGLSVDGKKVEDRSLRITVGASGDTAVSVPRNRPTIDDADGCQQVPLKDLENAVLNFSNSLKNPPPGGGQSPSKALDNVFNVFAVIDTLQKAGFAFKQTAKTVNRLEHEHKQRLIEQQANQLEKNGNAAATNTFNSAWIGVATGVLQGVTTGLSTAYQMTAYKQSGADTLNKPIDDNKNMLKEFQSFKGGGSLDDLAVKPPEIKPPEIKQPEVKQNLDINKEGQAGLPNESKMVELKDINEIKPEPKVDSKVDSKVDPKADLKADSKNVPANPDKVEKKSEVGVDGLSDSEREENLELTKLKGTVEAANDDFTNCREDVTRLTIEKEKAAQNLKEARSSGDNDQIKTAQLKYNEQAISLEAAEKRLDTVIDKQVGVCNEYKAKFDDLISKQEHRIAEAKKAPGADPSKIKGMQDRLGKLKSVRDGSCKRMGDQLKNPLEYRISKLRMARQEKMNTATNSKEFATGKAWEGIGSIGKSFFDSGVGFSRSKAEGEDGRGKSVERLIQRDVERVDTANDATKAMIKGADDLLELLKNLRLTAAQLDQQTNQAIWR